MARRYAVLEDAQAFVGTISGSAVVASILKEQTAMAIWFGLAAALMPLAALIFRWRDKATFFHGRSEAYQRLKLDMDLNRRDVVDIQAERAALEMQEGEPSYTIWRIAANEEARVRKTDRKPLSKSRAVLAVLFYWTWPA
jgi:hypothetical protein